MQSSIAVVDDATNFSLISLEDARMALNLVESTDKTLDSQIQMLVSWASDEVATQCMRDFALERVVETFRNTDKTSNNNRLYLSRYPVLISDAVDDVPAVTFTVSENGATLTAGSDYEIEVETGKLTRLTTNAWLDPVIVTYTGGYLLPKNAPPALRQATMLIAREAYYAMKRGDATIRMISHKESRVIYFDPNARGTAGGSGSAGSPARRAVGNLLQNYMRFNV